MHKDILLAKKEATKSKMTMRLGAVVYDSTDGKRFFGHNTNCMPTASVHAEMDALRKVLKRHSLLRKVRKMVWFSSLKMSSSPTRHRSKQLHIGLTVVRIGGSGILRSSKPCVECARVFNACRMIGITFDITYIDENGNPTSYRWDSDHKCRSHTF